MPQGVYNKLHRRGEKVGNYSEALKRKLVARAQNRGPGAPAGQSQSSPTFDPNALKEGKGPNITNNAQLAAKLKYLKGLPTPADRTVTPGNAPPGTPPITVPGGQKRESRIDFLKQRIAAKRRRRSKQDEATE